MNSIKKIKTGDKALDKWIKYFYSSPQKNTEFMYLLGKIDKYFLTVSPPQSLEEIDLPDNGLLEKNFRTIAFNDNPKLLDDKSKIIIAIHHNVNLKPWVDKYKETFSEVIEKCFIEGDYEKYGLEFEKLIKIAVDNTYIEKSEFMGIALLRGMLWGSRYDTPEKEEELKKIIKSNKLKTMFGF